MEKVIKSFEFEGFEFKVHSFDLDDGPFILNRLMKQLVQLMNEANEDGTKASDVEPENFSEMLIQQLLMNLDRETFKEIKKIALRSVSVEELVGTKVINQPVILPNGQPSRPEFNNFGMLDYLTRQALNTNMKPFFTKDGLRIYLTGQPVLSL